jgi:hypothetical protein
VVTGVPAVVATLSAGFVTGVAAAETAAGTVEGWTGWTARSIKFVSLQPRRKKVRHQRMQNRSSFSTMDLLRRTIVFFSAEAEIGFTISGYSRISVSGIFEWDFGLSETLSFAYLNLSPFKSTMAKRDFALSGTAWL